MANKRSNRKKRGAQKAARGTNWTRLWGSRGFVFFLALVVLFLGVSVTKELIRRVEMRNEIAQLELEVARLTDRNIEMSDVVALFSTSTQQDKEARVKLGLQSPGERVVIMPNRQGERDIVLPDSDRIEYIPVNDYETNPEKWFNFFWDKIETIYMTEA